MIETWKDKGLQELWCENCLNKRVETGGVFCTHCRKNDGEAPSNYVKDDSIKDSGERTEFSTGAVRDYISADPEF